jgi:hypothetical protein
MTIRSAAEFAYLRSGTDGGEWRRAEQEEAADGVWEDVIATHPRMRRWIPFNRTVPLDLLRRLAVDDDPDVRWAVAGQRRLDRGLFEVVAADPDPDVRRRVAWNAKVPYDLLLELARDRDPDVAESATRRLRVLPERRLPPESRRSGPV